MIVYLKVRLEIDAEEEQLEGIIQEMDYSFSYVRMEEDGNCLIEKEYIRNTEIVDYEVKSIY